MNPTWIREPVIIGLVYCLHELHAQPTLHKTYIVFYWPTRSMATWRPWTWGWWSCGYNHSCLLPNNVVGGFLMLWVMTILSDARMEKGVRGLEIKMDDLARQEPSHERYFSCFLLLYYYYYFGTFENRGDRW